jgi:hypothetical protein
LIEYTVRLVWIRKQRNVVKARGRPSILRWIYFLENIFDKWVLRMAKYGKEFGL